MLRLARADEKNKIQDIWYQDLIRDTGFNNYFFALAYPKGKHYVLSNDEIETVASVFKHGCCLHGRNLSTSIISDVRTLDKHKNKGNEIILLKEVINQLSRQDLLTLVHARNKELYQQLGFEVLYYRNCYKFERYVFEGVNTQGVTHEFKSEDLALVYRRFMQKFNGYVVRDKAYYDDYILELEFRKMHLMAVYQNDEIKAYFSFKIEGDSLYINECIYSDVKTLAKIISYCLKLAQYVYIYVSEAERLERIFKNTSFKTSEYMMARVNDYDLFNELYDCEVDNLKDAFKLLNRPLYIHEDL